MQRTFKARANDGWTTAITQSEKEVKAELLNRSEQRNLKAFVDQLQKEERLLEKRFALDSKLIQARSNRFFKRRGSDGFQRPVSTHLDYKSNTLLRSKSAVSVFSSLDKSRTNVGQPPTPRSHSSMGFYDGKRSALDRSSSSRRILRVYSCPEYRQFNTDLSENSAHAVKDSRPGSPSKGGGTPSDSRRFPRSVTMPLLNEGFDTIVEDEYSPKTETQRVEIVDVTDEIGFQGDQPMRGQPATLGRAKSLSQLSLDVKDTQKRITAFIRTQTEFNSRNPVPESVQKQTENGYNLASVHAGFKRIYHPRPSRKVFLTSETLHKLGISEEEDRCFSRVHSWKQTAPFVREKNS